jgi:predicted dehydrogenase
MVSQWSSSDKVEVIALSDESDAALRSAKSYLKDLVDPNIPTYLDHTDMLAREKIDWVMIGSKNCDHLRHCVDSFKANIHVFCEKPLAISVEQCEQLRAAHQKYNKIFVTGFVLRHAPLYKKIHEIVTDQKLLGKIISVEANGAILARRAENRFSSKLILVPPRDPPARARWIHLPQLA